MESGRETLKDQFRESLHVEIPESKWKKLFYIFFVIVVFFVGTVAIFIFLYLSIDEGKKTSESCTSILNAIGSPQGIE